MITIPSTESVWFDVDDTLIMWCNPRKDDERAIEIKCPASLVMDEDGKLVPSGEWTARVLPHLAHIEQLKIHKSRGHLIIVWSAGGWDWAQAAVKALGLEPYVDFCLSKPTWAYDDKKPEEYMPKSYYMHQEF